MGRRIDAFMRVGIVQFMAFPELSGGKGPWEETIRHIALDPFFNAIEITHIADGAVRERVRNTLQLARLSVVYAAQPVILGGKLNPNSLDEAERSKCCEVLKQHIDEAIFYGAESFALLSGKDPGEKQRAQATEALVNSLCELCDYSARKNGPRIVAEVFDFDIDKYCLLGPTTLASEVARGVREKFDNFGLLVDLSHLPLLKESPRQALLPVKEYLTGVHLGNAVTDRGCEGYGDNHPIFGTPGGVNDVPEVVEFLRCLFDMGFLNGNSRPVVSFEIKPLPGQDSLLLIAHAKRVLKEAWGLLEKA